MEALELQASIRTILGKRVRHLRKQGLLPVNLFGHDMESIPLQVAEKDFQNILTKAGTNTIINVKIDGSKASYPALIRGVQRHVISGRLLHADLYRVRMAEKIRLSVPLILVGEAPAVNQGGILLHNLDIVEIECFPKDLVHHIPVDISRLTEIGSAIYVKDLDVGGNIIIHTDPEELVVKVAPPEEEEMVTEVAPAEVEVVTKRKEKEEKEEAE